MSKSVIRLYSKGNSLVVKIGDRKNLQQDIENDPITRDQMSNIGCLLVCTFGNFCMQLTTWILEMKMKVIKAIKEARSFIYGAYVALQGDIEKRKLVKLQNVTMNGKVK